jgi:HEPN domain
MTGEERRNAVGYWQGASRTALNSAKVLLEHRDARACINCAYYAAYQAGTSACLAHKDEELFAHGWRNPSHEQLPDLLHNNGDLLIADRARLRFLLSILRRARETADYRPGQSIELSDAVRVVQHAVVVLELLGVEEKQNA